MTPDLPPDAGRSWWLREALIDDPGEPAPPLAGDTEADVVILGGGFTGMWTALHLTDREPGLRIVLLEQDICGGGPSGRNGGFVNSWWSGVGELAERLGDEATRALCDAGTRAVAGIESFCAANDLDAWFTRAGDMGVVTNAANDGAWQDRADQAASRVVVRVGRKRVPLSRSGAFRIGRRAGCGRLVVATDGAGGRTALRLAPCRH